MKWLTLGCLAVLAVLILPWAGFAQPQSELVGTYWRAAEINGNPVAAGESKREAHMVFNAEGRVSGSTGCNRFTGSYKDEPSCFSFTPLATTKMACPPPQDALERSFLQAMAATKGMRLSGNTLELLDAGDKVLMRLQAR